MQRLGPIAEFPEGEMRLLEIEGRSVGFVRRGEEIFGVLNVCPHRGAPVCQGELGGTMLPSEPGELRYGMEGLVLRCPWHGWEFDLRSGESVCGVDSRRLRVCPVAIEAGEVLAGWSGAGGRGGRADRPESGKQGGSDE